MAQKPKFSAWRRKLFLDHVRQYGNFTRACRAVDMNISSVRDTFAREPDFKAKYEEALCEAVDVLDAEARRRAVEGVEDIVVSQGRVVRYKGKPLKRREYSDRLLMFLLQAHGGDKYRAKQDITQTTHIDVSDVKGKLYDRLFKKSGSE